MTDFFPRTFRKNELNGPLETLAFGIGIFVGGYVGWQFGSEFVEYISQISSKNPNDVLIFLQNNPLVTKLAATGLGADYIGKGIRLTGSLVDRLFGTYHKSD